MKDMNEYWQQEEAEWHARQQSELTKLKGAQRHLYLNVAAYLGISVIEFYLAVVGHSQTLRADAFNNLSGIIASVLLLIGIYIARDIHDDDLMGKPLPEDYSHSGQRLQLTRFHYETVFTMLTGIVMMVIAASVVYSGIKSLMHPAEQEVPKPITLVGAAIATVIMLGVWWLNKRAGRKLKNAALTAAAQDSLSDAVTSLGTMVAIGGALAFRLTWLDGVASMLVGLFILKAGIEIFQQSSLNLADYFDPKIEAQFRQTTLDFPAVQRVIDLKAHYSGNVVTVDMVIVVDGDMSVRESYRLGEEIEASMRHEYGVVNTNVMTVPAN